jgi:hypothetical protein
MRAMNGAVWSKQWFDCLIETGNAALVIGHGIMDDADREELEIAIADLWKAFAQYRAGGADTYAAGRLMCASFLIGSHATVTTSHKRLLVDRPNQDRARLPRCRSPYHSGIKEALAANPKMRTKEIAKILGVECNGAFETQVSGIRKKISR